MGAERVKVFMAELRPVLELDAQFDGALGFAKEFVLVDAEGVVEQADRRNRRFAHADGADFGGFDHSYRAAAGPKAPRQNCSGHPARGAAAHDGNVAYAVMHEDRR